MVCIKRVETKKDKNAGTHIKKPVNTKNLLVSLAVVLSIISTLKPICLPKQERNFSFSIEPIEPLALGIERCFKILAMSKF